MGIFASSYVSLVHFLSFSIKIKGNMYYTTMKPMLKTVEINPEQLPPKVSVIWLHGLGASGCDFVDFVPEMNLPPELGVRFVFPDAPIRPITKFNGMKMRGWFDIAELSKDAKQDEVGIGNSQQLVDALIEQELARVPSSKILLAGFSQGGAMALHCGLRYSQTLGGILVLSGFLTLADKLSIEKNSANQNTPILMLHGKADSIVPIAWARQSFDYLKKLGLNAEWKSYPMDHAVCGEETQDIAGWLKEILNSKF